MTKLPESADGDLRPRVAVHEALQNGLARSWNTRSMLSHVLLPEGFALSLGLKEYRQVGHLKEALMGRRSPAAAPLLNGMDDLRDQEFVVEPPLVDVVPGVDLVGVLEERPGRLPGQLQVPVAVTERHQVRIALAIWCMWK